MLGEARAQIDGLLKSSKAVCGVLRPEEVQFLFPDHARQVGSAAVVPLTYGYPLGVLAIASTDAHYFRSSMGTLFWVTSPKRVFNLMGSLSAPRSTAYCTCIFQAR